MIRSHRFMVGVATVVALTAACAGDSTPAAPDDLPVRFTVTNDLVAPVTIAVDDVPYVILTTGRSSQITVSSKPHWLTWTSAKPADAEGRLIPDDVGQVRIPTSGINGTLEITNVINDQPYVTAEVFNLTQAQVSIGVSDGTSVSCAGILPPMAGNALGFVQIGYYRLLPTTEIRAYRDLSGCTGPYIAWPRSQITAFEPKSGLLTLTVETAP